MYTYTQCIAGINILTESDFSIPFLQQKPHSDFPGLDREADVLNHVQKIDPSEFTLGPVDHWERESLALSIKMIRGWLDSTGFRHPKIRQALRDSLEHPEQVNIQLAWNRILIQDFARNVLYLFYPPEQIEIYSTPLFLATYRNMLATFLPNFSAVLSHGAGLVFDGVAAVILASDGGGKSSAVKLAKNALILNDDQVVLHSDGETISVYSTPFGSVSDGPRKARLGGLFIIEKADEFKLIPIKPLEAFEFLWKENHHRIYVTPRHIGIRVWDILHAASHQVPAYRMKFAKNYIDWTAIESAITK